MSTKAFEVWLQLQELKRQRSASRSRRVQAEVQRVRTFANQIDEYAREYESQWAQAAQAGESVWQLEASAQFGQRLRETGAAQRTELESLEAKGQELLKQAQEDLERTRTLEDFVQRRKAQERLEQQAKEEKAQEDVLQARYRPPKA